MSYFDILQVQMGIPMWLIILIMIWAFVWKLFALWKSARKKQVIWFIVLAVVNLLGILEILYIYVFSEMNIHKKKEVKKKGKRK